MPKAIRPRCRTLAWGLQVLCLLLPAARMIYAQEGAPERFAEEMEVSEVLLDVLVTDSRDRVILGLRRDDFLVEEAGEPVELTGLTFYSSRRLLTPKSALGPAGETIDDAPEDRYFILFFQDVRRAAGEVPGLAGRQLDAVKDAGRWVREELQPGDRVAVVSWFNKLRLHLDFSRDSEALAAAIGSALQGDDPTSPWPSRRPEAGEGPSLIPGLPEAMEMRRRTGTIYEGLQVLARAAGAIRGRKVMIFFGLGFGDISTLGTYLPDPRHHTATLQTLNSNNVAVYTVDLSPMGSRHSLQASLDDLAAETGGTYYRFFTSFLTPLESVAEANNGYYLLSYTSTHPKGGSGYRRVRVRTRNPELEVRARDGYLYGSR